MIKNEIKMIGSFGQNKTRQRRMKIQMIKPFDQEKSSNGSSQDHDGDRRSQGGSLVTIFKSLFINNSIYFSNNADKFYSLDLKTGIINWTQSINSLLKPIIVDNIIFTISSSGYLYIIEKDSGNIIRVTDSFSNFKSRKRNLGTKRILPLCWHKKPISLKFALQST